VEPAPAEDRSGPPRLSIGEVVEALALEYPEVTPSSLRFLEREGLVVPQRTPGGHRLYRPADVDRLRRVKRWQRERLSLAEIRARLAAHDRLPAPEQLAATFLEHALAGQPGAARRTIQQAYEAGLPLARLFEEVLRPALYAVGDRWAAGRLTVGQEHEVTALVRDVLGELALRLPDPAPPRGVVVAAGVPGETHDLGLRMAAGVWAAHGYRVHYLGGDVPVEAILEALRRRGASVLLLAATLAPHYAGLEAVLRAVATLPPAQRPRVLAGGQAVAAHPDAVRALGAEPWLDLRRDPTSPPPAPPAGGPPAALDGRPPRS
jgi:MerR family transcriptional regulator, light-induced transcriptional regulator